MIWIEKIYIQKVLEGGSSIIDMDILFYYDNKMNCLYYVTALKLAR